MKIKQILPSLLFAIAAGSFTPNAFADYTIRCESFNKDYKSCRVSNPGYVRLKRTLSKSQNCTQGRSWDYNNREIWVDDGCKAEFIIEDRYDHRNNNKHNSSSSDAGKAVAAIAGIAILGAILGNKNGDKDNHDYNSKYDSDRYYGSRHTSYVPDWAIGKFRGYNEKYGSEVTMKISEDGRVSANANGEKIHGYYNDDRLHIGEFTFDISRNPNGFETRQHGDYRNTVRYYRVH